MFMQIIFFLAFSENQDSKILTTITYVFYQPVQNCGLRDAMLHKIVNMTHFPSVLLVMCGQTSSLPFFQPFISCLFSPFCLPIHLHSKDKVQNEVKKGYMPRTCPFILKA
jgi:hypothetical protein